MGSEMCIRDSDKRVDVVLGCGVGSDEVSTIVDLNADEPQITRQGAGELR